MDKVKITKQIYPDRGWLTYINSNGAPKQVSLMACANSFKLHTKDAYRTEDGLQPVGWRYVQDDCLCYELFCVGHVQLCCPLRPGVLQKLLYLLQGKAPDTAYLLQLEAFEKALNSDGWKTVRKPDNI